MIQDFVSCFSAPCQALIDATVVQLHYLDFLLETTNISDFYQKTMCTSLVSCHFEQEFTVDCIILFSASCMVNSHGFQIALLVTSCFPPLRYHYNVAEARLHQHIDKGNEDGLFISSVASSTNLWALIMDAGTGFTSQVYELSPIFLHKVYYRFLNMLLFSFRVPKLPIYFTLGLDYGAVGK
jgi:hypothetical protein